MTGADLAGLYGVRLRPNLIDVYVNVNYSVGLALVPHGLLKETVVVMTGLACNPLQRVTPHECFCPG